jgi:hypothetical protein
MAKFLSPYKTKWYQLELNDGYSRCAKKVFGKPYWIRRLKKLATIPWTFGNKKKYLYLYLIGLDTGEYNPKALEYIQQHLTVTGDTCEFVHPTRGNLWVGDIELSLRRLNSGITFFEPYCTQELLGTSIPDSNVVCAGYCAKNHSWWGWSHRACSEFKIGYVVSPDSILATLNPYIGDTMPELWEKALVKYGIKPGFTAKTIEDCRILALFFAEAVA